MGFLQQHIYQRIALSTNQWCVELFRLHIMSDCGLFNLQCILVGLLIISCTQNKFVVMCSEPNPAYTIEACILFDPPS